MADISVIKLPSGTEYSLKDAQARADIATLQNVTTGAMHYVGVTTTALSDGATTNPIKIDNVDYTAVAGDVAIYSTREYVFSTSDNKWHEFGSTGSLKALAFKDSASTKYTPAGSVSQPTFTGTSSTVTITATDNTSGNYQPKGSVTVTTKSTANKTATVAPAASGTATYTPSGSITNATFTGTATTSTGKFTPSGTVGLTNTNQTTTVSAATSGTATYTPAGSVGTPTISVKTAGTTTTIKNPTSTTCAKTVVAAAPGSTAPANAITYYSVSGETLSLYQLGYTTGASISTSDVTVKTGDAEYQSSKPSWTGTGARLVTGNISVPSSASFTGTEGNVSVSGTPTGSVSADFEGDAVRLVTGNIPVPSDYTATFTGTKAQLAGSTTASGTVSKPSFTGTEATITVS